MVPTYIVKQLMILPLIGLLLAPAVGCGNNTTYDGQDQQSSANQQAARAAAYGNSTNPAGKKERGKPAALGPEAAARQRGR